VVLAHIIDGSATGDGHLLDTFFEPQMQNCLLEFRESLYECTMCESYECLVGVLRARRA
jgi:hypothetical protein